MFSYEVAVVLGSDFAASSRKPHGLTVNPARPMNEDEWVETYDERQVAGKVLELVWLAAINLQYSNGHA